MHISLSVNTLESSQQALRVSCQLSLDQSAVIVENVENLQKAFPELCDVQRY